MSMGTKSPLYRPITPAIVPFTRDEHPALAQHIQPLYDILTDHCQIETLLWFATIDLLDRSLSGEREPELPGGQFGPSILLSVVGKEGQGKYQSKELKLLHDVIVEMSMAGRNYRRLQEYLLDKFDRQIVLFHSCGGSMICPKDLELYEDAVANEQHLRTDLDWKAETVADTDQNRLTHFGNYPDTQSASVFRIFERSYTWIHLVQPGVVVVGIRGKSVAA